MTGTLPIVLGAGLAALTLAHTAGADASARLLAGVIRRGPARPLAALTFDDGPDPSFTPQVLDILAARGVRASFFVLGAAAARHPELVRRMAVEGHCIGVHTWDHRHAWIKTPWGVARDLSLCKRTLVSITGNRPIWFRPPWGHFSAATLLLPARYGLRTALYSAVGGDWQPRITPELIYGRIYRRLGPGAIVLLHDHSPAPQATARMIETLPAILDACVRRGLRPITLDEMFEEDSHEPLAGPGATAPGEAVCRIRRRASGKAR